MGPTSKHSSDRMSTLSNVTSSSTSILSKSGRRSNSSSTVGETISTTQRPRLTQPALQTPTYPQDEGVLSMICGTTIHAPLQTVASLLVDARTYPSWNKFCPSITITHQPKSTAPMPACLNKDPAIESISNLHTTLRDGTMFTMSVRMGMENQSRMRSTPELLVTTLEQFEREGRTGVRIAWRIKGKMASFLTRSERVQEFIESETPDGTPCVDYICWETFYGLLASQMKSRYGTELEAGFAAWMDGLKAKSEDSTRGKAWPSPETKPTPMPQQPMSIPV